MSQTIQTNFTDGNQIEYKLSATGEKSVCCIAEGVLKMMLGRLYYVPVNSEINTDEKDFKILSDVSEKLDIRYIKNKIACVVPLQHNIKLEKNQDLCIEKEI
jgi:hypothetical protein